MENLFFSFVCSFFEKKEPKKLSNDPETNQCVLPFRKFSEARNPFFQKGSENNFLTAICEVKTSAEIKKTICYIVFAGFRRQVPDFGKTNVADKITVPTSQRGKKENCEGVYTCK